MSITALGTAAQGGTVLSASLAQAQAQGPDGSTASAAAGAEDAVAASFRSPVLAVDSTTGAAITLYRDGHSGDTLYQAPSRTTLLYRRQQALADDVQAAATVGGAAATAVSDSVA